MLSQLGIFTSKSSPLLHVRAMCSCNSLNNICQGYLPSSFISSLKHAKYTIFKALQTRHFMKHANPLSAPSSQNIRARQGREPVKHVKQTSTQARHLADQSLESNQNLPRISYHLTSNFFDPIHLLVISTQFYSSISRLSYFVHLSLLIYLSFPPIFRQLLFVCQLFLPVC